MRLGLLGLVLLGSALCACAPDAEPEPTPEPPSCVEKQRAILDRSGWELTQDLEAVIDALLEEKATVEELPICTDLAQ